MTDQACHSKGKQIEAYRVDDTNICVLNKLTHPGWDISLNWEELGVLIIELQNIQANQVETELRNILKG